MFLLPPTATCLAELADCPDVAAALGAEQSMRPVIPAVVEVDGTSWLTVPEDVGYPAVTGRSHRHRRGRYGPRDQRACSPPTRA